ncbi:MAG: hypothetical protein AMJ53_11700 [Gammaproteobacteria bacterium SG8_11]|nr:MAG: hypothetical protein AMJ53_11700 [Gammaproteobacteria bacterium SG8_11]
MKLRTLLLTTMAIAFLAGCASATYKPRNEGLTRFGYEETKTAENEYSIDYYGAKSDSYEKLEELWRKRAEEVCKSHNYQAILAKEAYDGKTFLLIPPFIYYDKASWPLLKGKLSCAA